MKRGKQKYTSIPKVEISKTSKTTKPGSHHTDDDSDTDSNPHK